MAEYLIDTNFLVRLITYDVPELAQQAEATITAAADETIELPLYVLAEVVYVLAYNTHYDYTRSRITKSLFAIIDIPQFKLNRDIASKALNTFNHIKLDFVDCLLIGQARHGAQHLLTFDKKLQRELG